MISLMIDIEHITDNLKDQKIKILKRHFLLALYRYFYSFFFF